MSLKTERKFRQTPYISRDGSRSPEFRNQNDFCYGLNISNGTVVDPISMQEMFVNDNPFLVRVVTVPPTSFTNAPKYRAYNILSLYRNNIVGRTHTEPFSGRLFANDELKEIEHKFDNVYENIKDDPEYAEIAIQMLDLKHEHSPPQTLDDHLVDAVKNGNLVLVQNLILQGANVHYRLETPLYFAVAYGNLNIVQYLLGASIDGLELLLLENQRANIWTRHNTHNLLEWAAYYGHLSIVRYSRRYNGRFYAIPGSGRSRRPPDRLPHHGEHLR